MLDQETRHEEQNVNQVSKEVAEKQHEIIKTQNQEILRLNAQVESALLEIEKLKKKETQNLEDI